MKPWIVIKMPSNKSIYNDLDYKLITLYQNVKSEVYT